MSLVILRGCLNAFVKPDAFQAVSFHDVVPNKLRWLCICSLRRLEYEPSVLAITWMLVKSEHPRMSEVYLAFNYPDQSRLHEFDQMSSFSDQRA